MISIIILVILFSLNGDFKTLKIKVSTNGGVPYRWEYEIADDKIVKYVKKYSVEKDETMDGGVVYINYVFEGLKEEKTTVKLKYVNILDNSIESEKVYNLKVNKHKNISLVVF